MRVTDHAVRRYRERIPGSLTDEEIRASIIAAWADGVEAENRSAWRAARFEPAEIRICDRFLAICKKGVIITVMTDWRRKFKAKKGAMAARRKARRSRGAFCTFCGATGTHFPGCNKR